MANLQSGVANSTQWIGIGDVGDGFFFGFNGTSFSIMSRKGGKPDIQTLTVTTASTTAENITITLDDVAVTDVTVTDSSGDKTVTANEIAAGTYSGWRTEAVGDKVIFISDAAEAKAGTFSLSSATTAVGSFAETIVGVAPTETIVAQTAWNGDKFDGTGETGVTLDPTKGNVFEIQYQWLGFGRILFKIEDPDDGGFHTCHNIAYANTNTAPSIDNPTLPLMAIVSNTSNTSDIVLRSGSMGGFVEGLEPDLGVRHGFSANVELTGVSTETPILTIRNKDVYQSLVNRVPIKIHLIGTSVEHSKPCVINFYKNATLVGASFSDIDANTSVTETDTSATSFSGGTLLFSLSLGKTGDEVINFIGDSLHAGETLTATINPASVNGAEGSVSLNFTELF